MNTIKIIKLCTVALITCIWSISSYADWQVSKTGHNIKLLRSTDEQYQYTSIIEAQVNTPINTIVEVIEDPDACNKWLFRCQTARQINRTEDNHLYTYYVRDYPFPLKDRHGVLQIKRGFQENGEFHMELTLIHNMTPEDNTLIVPDQFSAMIKLVSLDTNKTQLTMEHNLNPGGKIPNWLKKSIHEEFPYKSILGLVESAHNKQQAARRNQQESGVAGL